MAIRYVRVKDKRTKHEYDVLEHKVDPDKHTRLDKKHYPAVSRPRPAKPFTSKGGGPGRSTDNDKPSES